MLAAGDFKNLSIIDTETGQARQILRLEADKESLGYFTWHPSGEQLAMTIRNLKDQSCRVLIKNLEGETVREITGAEGAAWSPQGTYFYFYPGSRSQSKGHLFKTDDMTPVSESSDISFINFSPDEKKIAIGRIKEKNDIFATFSIEIMDLNNRQSWKPETEKGFRSFSFSPDSKWIVCDEAIFDLTTKEKKALPGYPAIFSPDSRYLALLSFDVNQAMIFDLEKEEIIWSGDFEPTPTDIYPGNILGERAMFSSDGSFFIYTRKFWKPDIISVELSKFKEKEINLKISEPASTLPFWNQNQYPDLTSLTRLFILFLLAINLYPLKILYCHFLLTLKSNLQLTHNFNCSIAISMALERRDISSGYSHSSGTCWLKTISSFLSL